MPPFRAAEEPDDDECRRPEPEVAGVREKMAVAKNPAFQQRAFDWKVGHRVRGWNADSFFRCRPCFCFFRTDLAGEVFAHQFELMRFVHIHTGFGLLPDNGATFDADAL
ncbi:MAG: hypothetical protein IPJ47_12290 [Anaerolineales bacterium]|nr:hypothetical protein [Anaerolineales bacterium]